MMSNYFLIQAGRRRVGDVAYDEYIGQIKPADIPSIIWYHPAGNDATGTGSLGAPYQTKARAILDISDTKFYVLDYTLAGRYKVAHATFNILGEMYVHTTLGNDANPGSFALPKLTWAAARAVVGIHTKIIVLNTTTLTDMIDFPTEGAIGETLTLDRAPTFPVTKADSVATQAERSLAYGNGLYVSVTAQTANNTTILRTSPDGLVWTLRGHPWTGINTGYATDVCFGTPGGSPLFVACASTTAAYDTLVITSPDGITWTAQTTTTNAARVIWMSGLNLFVLVGKNRGGGAANRIMTSPDGITWTLRTSSWADAASVYTGLDTDGTTIVATGYNTAGGIVDGQMETSTDGITWTTRLINVPRLHEVRQGGGRWIVISEDAGTLTTNFYETTTPLVAASWVKDTQNLTGTLRPFNKSLCFSVAWGFICVSNANSRMIWRPATGATAFLPESGDGFASTGQFDSLATAYEANHVISNSLPAIGNREAILVASRSPAIVDTSTYRIIPESSAIRSDVTNAVIAVTKSLAIANKSTGVNAYTSHVDAIPTSLQAFVSFGSEFYNCRTKSVGVVGTIVSKTAKIRNSIMEGVGDLVFTGFAAVAADIEVTRNVWKFAGFDFRNAGGLNREVFRDNIIEANFVAQAVTTMESGNFRGAGANVALGSLVTQIDPLFRELVNYNLQREYLAGIFDSYMVARSTFEVNAVGAKRDLGAQSSFAVNEEVIWLRTFPFLLPSKVDAMASIKHNRVNLHVSETGVPDVVNSPDGTWEELLMTYGSLPTEEFGQIQNHLEFLDWFETETDMTCNLRLDPMYTPAASVTTGAASAVGVPFIVIASGTLRSGMKIVVAGKEYFIGLVSGVYGVLDRGLEDAVSNAQVIEVKKIIGYGEYKYVPQTDRKLTRWQWNRTDFMRGFIMRFARKWV
jgi:hypothetical protein